MSQSMSDFGSLDHKTYHIQIISSPTPGEFSCTEFQYMNGSHCKSSSVLGGCGHTITAAKAFFLSLFTCMQNPFVKISVRNNMHIAGL